MMIEVGGLTSQYGYSLPFTCGTAFLLLSSLSIYPSYTILLLSVPPSPTLYFSLPEHPLLSSPPHLPPLVFLPPIYSFSSVFFGIEIILIIILIKK